MNGYNPKSPKGGLAAFGAYKRNAATRRAPALPARLSNQGKWNAGYTLVETLVAVMLLAIALTIVLQLFSGAMNAGRLSSDYNRAIWYAREKMNEIQLTPGWPAGISQGQLDNRYRWEAIIEPETANIPGAQRIVPLKLQVRITWRHGLLNKKVEFSTMALRAVTVEG